MSGPGRTAGESGAGSGAASSAPHVPAAARHASTDAGAPSIAGAMRRVEIRPGRRLAIACRRGTTDADTVVFLCHGAGGNLQQWRFLWRELAARGLTLVAWDLLGHGGSARPLAASRYAGEELVADYLAVIERHRGPRNVLVGHSYGSGLTLTVLARLARDDRLAEVDRAILLGARLFRERPPLLARPLPWLWLIRSRLERDFRAAAWHRRADPALVDHEERIARRNSLHVFKSLFAAPSWITPAQLAQLRLPVMVVAGDADGITPPQAAEPLVAGLPEARLQVIERCGHQIMLEQPEALAALVLPFIQAR